jgi:FkbM family methyltransferase
MSASRIRSIVKAVLPPVIAGLFQKKPRERRIAPASPMITRVEAGPLQGARMMLDVSRPAFDEMRRGAYDSFVWSSLPPFDGDTTVIDVGAHIGYTTLAFAALYPRSRVIAFEPNPINLERLAGNVDLNPSLGHRITLHQVALGDRKGEALFFSSANVDDETSSGGHLDGITPPLDPQVYTKAGFRSFTVPVRRLDEMAQEGGWGPIGLMKIDVEGAEHLVLAGCSEVLQRSRPVLSIEVHSVTCMLALANILQPLDYELRAVHEHRPSRAHIVAIPRSRP